MPELIKGMYHVEYLAIFYSIIIGVIATEFFSGWSMIIRYRAISKPYPLHLVWSIFGFITLLQNWYGIWPRIEFINKNFLYFLWGCIPMIMFYFIAIVTFPTKDQIIEKGYKIYHNNNIKVLYVLFALYFFSAIISSILYEDIGNVTYQNLLRILGVLICIGGIFLSHKKWYQIATLIFFYSGIALFLLALYK
tara:strand:- start:39 stop:617 length:579 start_codon:yes stop_codon:yes gene_type:complete